MLDELSFFQENAVNALIRQSEMAVFEYKNFAAQQVISLTAPTGSGKTIMMAAFIERILFGSENNLENPDAVFVWLSDSPALNEQSKNKIGAKAEKVGFGRCITIEDESFNQEMLDDGKVYFLNTQKLSKSSNLVQKKDGRDYTIWETLNNTVEEKGDRLYFIIDEAHRGAKTNQTTIMQKFLKGDKSVGLKPMPLVIGMSATSERFKKLAEVLVNVNPRHITVQPSEVRDSGLLKDKIIIYYPEDTDIHDNMAILQAATDEWKEKCKHWFIYSKEQKDKMVNPVFVIQVEPGKGDELSNTDLNECLLKIEERSGWKFNEGEVVHTFGSASDIEINGLKVPYIEPQDIADDRNIRIVFFKENLSTGWDCPRAETMMSFRHANDATYIAQLLGRMIRTPLQRHINVDEYLNDVRLYLPYFNRENADKVADALRKDECDDLPTEIETDSTGSGKSRSWGLEYTGKSKDIEGQMTFGETGTQENGEFNFDDNYLNYTRENTESENEQSNSAANLPAETSDSSEKETEAVTPVTNTEQENPFKGKETTGTQIINPHAGIDRRAVLKFINKLGIETYSVRPAKTTDYIDSMLKLAHVIVKYKINPSAVASIHNDIIEMIHNYAQSLRANGKYDDFSKRVLQFKLLSSVFNAFGEEEKDKTLFDLSLSSDADLDRKKREAETVLGRDGIIKDYVNHYYDEYYLNELIVDCILFSADKDCMEKLRAYAKKKFTDLNDENRIYTNSLGDSFKNEYNNIVRNGEAVIPLTFGIPSRIEPSNQMGGKEYDNHLFIDPETGFAKIRLNGWEESTIGEEAKRSDFVCWLRNPPGAKWSLCVPYTVDNEAKAMYPDFIIVRYLNNVGYVLDILEPHGPQYTDNLPKAQGLVAYANKNTCVGRVQMIREVSDGGVKKLRRLDLAKTAVKDEVLKARTVNEFNHIFNTMGVFDD